MSAEAGEISVFSVGGPTPLVLQSATHCCCAHVIVCCLRHVCLKPIEEARFPASLKTLSFGACFNRPVEDAEFPQGLEGLFFGDKDKVAGENWGGGWRKLFREAKWLNNVRNSVLTRRISVETV